VTGLGQVMQSALHALHQSDAPPEIVSMPLSDLLHRPARAAAISIQLQQFADLSHAESEIAGAANKSQHMNLIGTVLPVT